MAAKRIAHEPAYVLHRYDWSESSLILEVFTRHYGRIALVAKGAKKPSSNFRPVLLPMQPLRVTFGGDAEIRTLKEAEWVGGHVMPTGDALLAGYYLNELLIRLLPRDDANTALFDTYASAMRVLASEHGDALEPALRAFELLMLRETGVLPALDQQTTTMAPLVPGEHYTLVPEGGLVRVRGDEGRSSLEAAAWTALEVAMGQPAPYGPTVREAANVMAALKPLLRGLLHYHCGVTTLRTRQLMIDLQSL